MRASFTDGCGLVLHKGHTAMTYFGAAGGESRLMVADTTTSDGAADKLRYLALMHNYACTDGAFIDSGLVHDEEQVLLLTESVLSCRWPCRPVDNKLSSSRTDSRDVGAVTSNSLAEFMPESKAFRFTAIEKQCAVTLHYSGWLVEIEYLRVVRQQKKGVLKKKNVNEVSGKQKKRSYDLKTSEILNPLEQKPEDDEDIELASQCIRQTQKFHIFNYPVKFSYPVFVLLQERYRLFNEEAIRQKIDTLFCPKFKEIINRVQIYNEITEEGENFLRKEYLTSHLSGFFIVQLNSFKDIEAQINEATKVEPKMSRLAKLALNFKKEKDTTSPYGYKTRSSESRITADDLLRTTKTKAAIEATLSPPSSAYLWPEHVRNPNIDLLDLGFIVDYLYQPNYETFFAGGVSVTLSLLSQTVILNSMANSQYTCLMTDGEAKTMSYGTTYTLRKVEDGKIVSEENVGKIIEIVERCKRINNAAAGSREDTKAKIERFGVKKKEEEIEGDPLEVVTCMASDRAICEAFKNKSVKLKFSDRTILQYDPNNKNFSIFTKLGEQHSILVTKPGPFLGYLQEAIDFQDYVFTDPVERLRRIEDKEALQRAIALQLEQSKQFSNIINRKGISQTVDPESLLPIRRLYMDPIESEKSSITIKKPLDDHFESPDPFSKSRYQGSLTSFGGSDHLSMNWRTPKK